MVRNILLLSFLLLFLKGYTQPYIWTKLNNAPYNGGKQDDIYFINPDTGWSVNGCSANSSGKIYRTYDGGASWTNLTAQPGTYFRCIGFINNNTGFAGNVGTDYYPNVTDTVPFYKTIDGGATWNPVSYTGPVVKGLCAVNSVATQFVNAGHLDTNYTIYAAGRVGSPPYLLKSVDNGNTWTSKDLSSYIAMITDVKFVSKDTGFVFGGTNGDISLSYAKILYTFDGGNTFTSVYQSSRVFEMIWKGCIPVRNVGYATVLSYSTSSTQRYVVKTTNGGLNWSELLLAGNSCEEFGVGFVNDSVGWVGTDGTGYQTLNGGTTWTTANIGQYANKIRFVPTANGFVGYAIGLNVFKTSYIYPAEVRDPGKEPVNSFKMKVFPNPTSKYVTIQYHLYERQQVMLEMYDLNGKKLDVLANEIQDSGNKTITYSFKQTAARMVYFVLTTNTGQSKIQVWLQP